MLGGRGVVTDSCLVESVQAARLATATAAAPRQRTADRETGVVGTQEGYRTRSPSRAARPEGRRLLPQASVVGGLPNQTELGRDVALPQPTVHR